MILSHCSRTALKEPDITNKSFKHAVIKLIIVLLIASCSLLHAAASHSANTSGPPGFVYSDFSASIKALQRRVENVSPGIVLIVAYDITGTESGSGTGFFMDPNGRIITNAAVLKNAYSAEVISKTNYYDSVTILNYDESLDLALIQVNAIDESPLDIDFEYEVKQNDKADIIGKSRDSKITISEGSISSVNTVTEDLELIEVETKLPISHFKASKDGPLLNLYGQVIGMSTTSISELNVLGIATTVSHENKINAVSLYSIKLFLSKPGSASSLHPPGSRVWHKFIIQKLTAVFTTSFAFLFDLGVPIILGILFAILVLLSLIEWIYNKLKKTLSRR
jgi:S1-C subfamily serine protease